MSSTDKISCQICGDLTHSVQIHLRDAHPGVTIEQYRIDYPLAPELSAFAQSKLDAKIAERRVAAASSAAIATGGGGASVISLAASRGYAKCPMHEVFDLGKVKAAMNARGEPIMISTLSADPSIANLVPEKDTKYVFNIDLLKTVLMGMELNMPTYLWGYHGTGKTTNLEQVAAHTGRPYLRVQHTINTEESHILGQTHLRGGETFFEMGPLPFCMKYGIVYCADEYDFAMPSVLAVYQAVLEGKPLIIKEAPLEDRVIKPHPNFRFVATGNTNGGGDETGLYQGTQIGNAANYSRFGIVEEVSYMPAKQETAVVAGQSGIDTDDAEKLVKFAAEVRTNFAAGRISGTMSPRELINAAKIGLVRGSDWRAGLRLAFTNRLSRTDKEVVDQFAQRIFG